jgi:hypothetical protein
MLDSSSIGGPIKYSKKKTIPMVKCVFRAIPATHSG